MSRVASPPSSTIWVGPAAVAEVEGPLRHVPVLLEGLALPGEDRRAPRASPRCRSGPPPRAAAAWSWVEKMLQEHQRTSAPRSFRVSISTAVWIVMCRLPVMRWPAQRLLAGVLLAHRHEARHLLLGEPDLLAAPLREGEVGHLVLEGPLGRGGVQRRRHCFLSPSLHGHGIDGGARPVALAPWPAPRPGPSPPARGEAPGRRRRRSRRSRSISRRSAASKPRRCCPIASRNASWSWRSRSTTTARPPGLRMRAISARTEAGLGHVGERQHEKRRVASRVLDRQRLEAPLAQLHVRSTRGAAARGLQHGRGLVHADHPRDVGRRGPR